jgi:PAT family beta-lactamase induction signal transducer AmpG
MSTAMAGSDTTAPAMTLRKKLFWISVLYFAQGMPFGVVIDVLPVYFRNHGVALRDIGLMAVLTMPWTIKPLWSPLVDRWFERRTWVTFCCAVMAIAMLSVPLFDPASPTLLLWGLLLAFTLASATQDIAIDAFCVGILAKGEEGVANGVRVSWYRVAVMASGGTTMYLVSPFGWHWVFLALGLAFIVMAIAAWASPPVPVVHQAPREYARQFLRFLTRPGSVAVFGFILLYKIGDVVMGPMVKPFWVDRGMSAAEIGTISTNAGMALGILGAILGGWFTTRAGIFHGLWVMGLGQALSNLCYAGVAHFDLGRPALYGASMFESFTMGLGTAAFLAFMTRICDKDQAASQYALLSALYALPRPIVAPWSGRLTESLGYAGFFFLTFLASFPAYALLPWVRRWTGNGEAGGRHAAAPDSPAGDPQPAATPAR